MPTTGDFVTAARAKTLVQLICGEPDAGVDPSFEQTERVAHAVGTYRQRAIVWLRQILEWEGGSRRALRTLGFDRSVVDVANTLVRRHRESVGKYAQRVAACNDSDVLAVAVAAIDDEIREEIEHQRDMLAAHTEARRVLKRVVDAQLPGDPPPAGGVADDRPPADLSDELLALVDHTHGAQDALRHMLRDPGNALRGSLARLSPDDRDLLVANVHDLMQIVAVLVFDVTARDNENTPEDRMTPAGSGSGLTGLVAIDDPPPGGKGCGAAIDDPRVPDGRRLDVRRRADARGIGEPTRARPRQAVARRILAAAWRPRDPGAS